MTTKERQKAILSYLRDESTPVSATTLAKLLGVSRQIIVGDVALLRAAGTHVVATSRGYVIPPEEGSVRQVVCQHTPGQTQEELYVMAVSYTHLRQAHQEITQNSPQKGRAEG